MSTPTKKLRTEVIHTNFWHIPKSLIYMLLFRSILLKITRKDHKKAKSLV